MVHLLNIHTATETAIVNLMGGAEILGTFSNQEAKQHASFLHTAIKELLQLHGVDIRDLNAIGVTAGPGSYTGIRVGLATAKGLCYALKIPLITYNGLEVMAITATKFTKDHHALYSPIIDARRMEVYTAIYDYDKRNNCFFRGNSYRKFLYRDPGFSQNIFSGSGSHKFQQVVNHPNAIFLDLDISSESLAKMAWKKYTKHDFSNVPYAQPLYIK